MGKDGPLSRKTSRHKVKAAPAPASAPPAASPLREWLAAALLLLLVLILLHPAPIFQGLVYSSGDARNADSFALVGNAALAGGDYPQWNPYLFAGMPTFGSLAYVRFLYPPGEIFTFLQDRLGFPPLTWMLAHMLLGGLGMIFLLGRWRLPVAARVGGACLWLLLPKVVAWGVYGHGSKLGAAMYLPWIVGLTLDVLDGKGRRRVGLLGLLCGLQILRGHIQITYYTLIVVGLLIAARWIGTAVARRRAAEPWPWRGSAAAAGAIVLGFMIGAVLLLPVKEYAGWSIRGQTEQGGGVSYQYATGWSLAPAEMGTLVLPAAAGFGKGTYQGLMPFTDYPNYMGLLALALAGAAIAAASGRRRETLIALGAIGLLAVMVAWGRFAPILYEPLFRFLPYFNKFRVPSMALVLTGFAAAVLAAHGLAAVTSSEPRAEVLRRRLGIALGVLGFALVVGSFAGRGLFVDGLARLAAAGGRPAPGHDILAPAWAMHKTDLLRIGMILLTAGLGLARAVRVPRVARALPWLLLVLLVLDLGAVDRRITHPENGLREQARAADGSVRLVRAGGLLRPFVPAATDMGRDPAFAALAGRIKHDRVWPLGRLSQTNDFMAARIHSLGGYHPAKLAAFEQIRKRLNDPRQPAGRIAGWLGARALAVDGPLPRGAAEALASLGTEIEPAPFHTGAMALYAIGNGPTRARLADRWEIADGDFESFLDRLQAGREPYGATVRLDRTPSPAPVAGDAPLPEPEFLTDETDEIVITVDAPRPALLVLADMTVPGWSATVDGEPATLLAADHVLRAVALDAGPHEVRFVFHDPALRTGLTLTVLGLLAAAALMLIRPRRRRAVSVAREESP